MSDAKEAKKIHVQLVQKPHNKTGPYYVGAGRYYGFMFEQLGEHLVAEVDEEAAKSNIDAKRFKKLSANAYKELVAEAAEE